MVAPRVGDHPLEQAAVLLLGVSSPGELGASVAQPQGERVPGALEVAAAKHPRAADRSDAPVEVLAREGGGEELTELALEAGDLAPQVVAGAALGGLGQRLEGGRPRRRRRGSLELLERLGHGNSF
jgi:hypothetical protein